MSKAALNQFSKALEKLTAAGYTLMSVPVAQLVKGDQIVYQGSLQRVMARAATGRMVALDPLGEIVTLGEQPLLTIRK
jgi:hypothetical protein